MLDSNQLQAISDWLESARRPLLFSHRRPDGDALGALSGMSLALRRLGSSPRVALFEPLPPRFERLRGSADWRDWNVADAAAAEGCDSVIIVDTCSLSQLEPALEYLRGAPRMLVLDHHATRDELGIREGDLRVIDESASAASLIVAEWLAHARLELDPPLATALWIGLASDCGWFRFSNTDARTLRAAAALAEAGADVARLYRELYQQDPPEKLKLIGRMLATLELKAGQRLAVMALRRADFTESGANDSMTEDLVNEAGRLACTEATVLFTEEPDGVVRANLRSKEWFDVAELARRYGGGGHARAAGARLRGTWENVVPRFVAEFAEALGPG